MFPSSLPRVRAALPPKTQTHALACDSLAEWSKALASGASPQGRGFEPHSSHQVAAGGPLDLGLNTLFRAGHAGNARARNTCITILQTGSAISVSTCGLVAMTSASHAEGRQFDPGLVYFSAGALSVGCDVPICSASETKNNKIFFTMRRLSC